MNCQNWGGIHGHTVVFFCNSVLELRICSIVWSDPFHFYSFWPNSQTSHNRPFLFLLFSEASLSFLLDYELASNGRNRTFLGGNRIRISAFDSNSVELVSNVCLVSRRCSVWTVFLPVSLRWSYRSPFGVLLILDNALSISPSFESVLMLSRVSVCCIPPFWIRIASCIGFLLFHKVRVLATFFHTVI